MPGDGGDTAGYPTEDSSMNVNLPTERVNEQKSDTAHMIGITDTLAAGPHTLSVRHGKNVNFAGSISEPNPVIGAVLLGG